MKPTSAILWFSLALGLAVLPAGCATPPTSRKIDADSIAALQLLYAQSPGATGLGLLVVLPIAAFGIATAIPAVLAYNYGLRRTRLYVAEMEDFATDFLHLAMKSAFKVE